jgi:ABC-type multidrug transport system permease subunit
MMTLGAVFEDLSIAVLLGGGFVLFNIGFAGFMLNLNTLPEVVKWVQWISPMKYALEAVTINEINGLTIEDSLSGVPCE